MILKKNDYICAIEFYKKNMAKNGDTRKLLLDIDIETMEYINDYKYAMLLSQGIVRQRRKEHSKLFPGRSMCVRWKSADAKHCRPASYGRNKIRSNTRRA